MRGRRPTPTYLRLLQGNPQHRPINKNEPRPPTAEAGLTHLFSSGRGAASGHKRNFGCGTFVTSDASPHGAAQLYESRTRPFEFGNSPTDSSPRKLLRSKAP